MSNPIPLASQASWPVFGHEWAVEYLQRIIAADSARAGVDGAGRSDLRNAYLFLGAPQVGKSTLVRAFARALLCTGTEESGQRRPCGECRSCRLMKDEKHPDFRVFAPTDSDGDVDRINGQLRVPHAEEFVHEVALRPVENKFKIFHIQDAQLGSANYFNRVLKAIEEPPEHVVICLTATDRSLLLPTIVSRCEVAALRSVPVSTVREALIEHWHVDPAQAELLARISNGRLGWAVRQLNDKAGAIQRLEMLDALRELVSSSRVARLQFAEKTSAKRDSQRLFGMLELWVSWWRDVLLKQHGCAESISNIDHMGELEECAGSLSAAAVQRHLNTLLRTERYLHHTVNTRMALDALLLDIPRPGA